MGAGGGPNQGGGKTYRGRGSESCDVRALRSKGGNVRRRGGRPKAYLGVLIWMKGFGETGERKRVEGVGRLFFWLYVNVGSWE